MLTLLNPFRKRVDTATLEARIAELEERIAFLELLLKVKR